jgi:magnesium-protoporphyrin IX monomethyl ester (oxidative) cyclase
MFVRDAGRPVFHKALGLDPTDYDMQVFRITQEISKQVFPVLLDVDNPAFLANLQRLRRISVRMDEAKAKGGVLNKAKRLALTAGAAAVLGRLFFLRPQQHDLPAQIRVAPAW